MFIGGKKNKKQTLAKIIGQREKSHFHKIVESTILSFLNGLMITQSHWCPPLSRENGLQHLLLGSKESPPLAPQNTPDSSICLSVAGATFQHSPLSPEPCSLWGKHLGCYYVLWLVQWRLCQSSTPRHYLAGPIGSQGKLRLHRRVEDTTWALSWHPVCFTFVLSVSDAKALAELGGAGTEGP